MSEGTFTYSNKAGSGGFLLSEVSGWHKATGSEWYNLYLKRDGCQHSLTQDEFERFLPLWGLWA